MASVIVDDGLEWVSQKIVGNNPNETAYIIAVGDDNTAPSSSDTSLGNELYRADDDDSNTTIEATSNVGEIDFRITISGGTEVPAGSDVVEFGVFISDGSTLLYREVLDTAVTIESGNRSTFEFTIDITN